MASLRTASKKNRATRSLQMTSIGAQRQLTLHSTMLTCLESGKIQPIPAGQQHKHGV
ncbi:hypothetical protein GUITHDRAFT_151830 [Guillardia theta CCMP2712]|uniref:Uncharacterized protein n=1 Tax=Guillardia theta (strain CCMP2712) TaxID=905079 RepID=L1JI78_GUITC|nr:hypothetical protein GUITHDRAFT_151830 [Guillardia theta CCMP2712]EKX48233.1 hypothetical protein GUITHDRAFT_151830 [Guillardia theta CCMP2712]|eukprot:XP_005835213.1 hypothetical protein GUITHDRAFT_151830 [Guillardia theta CCMP2712]